MTTNSKNLVEEIIDNAIDPSTHLVEDDLDPSVPDPVDMPAEHTEDPLNKNLVPDPDKA